MSTRIGPTVVVSTASVAAWVAHSTTNGASHSLVKDATVKCTPATVDMVALGTKSALLNGDGAKNFVPESIIVTVTDVDFPAFLVCGAATAYGVAWTGVADGAFNITADGVGPIDIVGCSFAACANMDDVAAVVQTQLRVSVPLALVVWDTDHFKITSGSTDVAVSAIVALASPAGGTDISGAGGTAFLAGTVATGAVLHPVPTMDGAFTVGLNGGTGVEINTAAILTGLYQIGHTVSIGPTPPWPDISGTAMVDVIPTVPDSTSINFKVRMDVTGRQW